MPFTDEDLKRLKDEFEPYVEGDPRILTGSDWLGLIARLEAAEKAIFLENSWDRDRQIEAWRKEAGK